MQTLFEEMVNKGLITIGKCPERFTLELAYSIEFDARVDRQIGSLPVQYKEVRIERN